jgi:nucleotide-binding universal stress UspA family protein
MSQDRAERAPILAAFSPSSPGREPVVFGLAASRLTGAPLIVVVVRPGGPGVAQYLGDIDDSPDDARTVEHLRLDLERQGHRDVEVKVLSARTVGGGLNEAARDLKPMLVVLGTSGRGVVGSVLMGSKAEGLIHDVPCPVAVVPKGYRGSDAGLTVIGGACGPKGEGAEALHSAAALAQAGGVRLRAIVVIDGKEGEPATSEQQAQAEARVRETLGDAAGRLELETDVRVADPADGLVAASRDVDLLVIGSRGRGARRAALLGSVSRKVAANAACPLLVLPEAAGATSESLIGSVEAT